MKKYLIISLLMFAFLVVTVSAATTDFTADGNVTVDDVTNGSFIADLLIMSGSKAESWNFNGGDFTVTNPDLTATFHIGSSDTSVKSLRDTSPGMEEVCADNTTPGISYITVPNSGIHTVFPSTETCSGSGSGDGGGGGGGGHRVTPPGPPPVVPPVVNPPQTPNGLPFLINPNFSHLTPAEKQVVIAEMKTQLRSLIMQLVQLLRAQLLNLQNQR